jgi:hypothetical protein
VAAVAVGSRNTHYWAARYGPTQTGLPPVGLRQLFVFLFVGAFGKFGYQSTHLTDNWSRIVESNESLSVFYVSLIPLHGDPG